MDWGLKDQSKCVLKANFTGEIIYWLKERLMDWWLMIDDWWLMIDGLMDWRKDWWIDRIVNWRIVWRAKSRQTRTGD